MRREEIQRQLTCTFHTESCPLLYTHPLTFSIFAMSVSFPTVSTESSGPAEKNKPAYCYDILNTSVGRDKPHCRKIVGSRLASFPGPHGNEANTHLNDKLPYFSVPTIWKMLSHITQLLVAMS